MGEVNGSSLGKLITIGIKEFSSDLFTNVSNVSHFCKPHGGLWSSSYTPEDEYVSDWHRFCNNVFNEVPYDSIVFTLKSDTKVYEIDSRKDLEDLFSLVGTNDNESSLPEEIGTFLEFPNFEKCTELFDAIHLTIRGQWETRGLHYQGHNLYGWDVESILLLNPNSIESWTYNKLKNIKIES